MGFCSKKTKDFFAIFLLLFLFQLSAYAKSLSGPVEFFYAPQEEAVQPIIDAIDASKKNIKMTMFHLSNPTVASAMMFAAKRGVDVNIIFDKGQWRKPNDVKLIEDMKAAGVKIYQATSGFSITHIKAMVIDDKKAMISTMNQTRAYNKMLDFGIFTTEKSIIQEMNSVFAADLKNSESGGNETPELTNDFLIWSPNNSLEKLLALINSAKYEIQLIVENLGHADIQNALLDAAKRGVSVQVLVPMCNLVKINLNYPFVQALRSGMVDAKMLPGPSSQDLPYVHAKSILVDNKEVYLGSENFSYNSLMKARELGIIVTDEDLTNKIQSLFYTLWPKAQLPPSDANYKCATQGMGDSGSDEGDVGGRDSNDNTRNQDFLYQYKNMFLN